MSGDLITEPTKDPASPARQSGQLPAAGELPELISIHRWLNRAVKSAAPLLKQWKLVPLQSRRSDDPQSTGERPGYLMRYTLRDFLTQLPNRALFSDRLDAALQRARAREHCTFALLSIDMDRFQVVNESLGRSMGDELLVAVAERTRNVLGDHHVLGRVGGDRFAAIIENGLSENVDVVAAGVAEAIQASLASPVLLGRREIFVSASIGIVVVGHQYENAEDILRDADIALFNARQKGKGRSAFFDSEMHLRVVNNLDLEMDLRRAIERCEFEMFYQPIVNANTGELFAYEALVRWRHPVRGLLLPASFLSTLMETGEILRLGKWVIAEVCHQAGVWAVKCGRPVPVSINLSAREFGDPGTVDAIFKALEESGADAAAIKLEITEDALVEYAGIGKTTMNTLNDHGLQLLIDDFGTGYSSLSYLGRLPVGGLKVPRELVACLDKKQDRAVVASIVALAHVLGMEVIAEGVENADQLEILREMGCEYVQGYLISRPVDADAAFEMLAFRFQPALLASHEVEGEDGSLVGSPVRV